MNAKAFVALAAVGLLLTRKKKSEAAPSGYTPPTGADAPTAERVTRPPPSSGVEILQRNLNTFYRNVQNAMGIKAFNAGPILAGEPLNPVSSARSPQATTPTNVTYYGSSTTCPTTGALDVDGKFGRCTARAYWIAWAATTLAQPFGSTPSLKDFAQVTLGDLVAETDTDFWRAIARGVNQVHAALYEEGLSE
jgi:hypothetical protein